MAQMRFHCERDTLLINDLLVRGQESHLSQPEALVAFYAQQLLGTPYVAHTLEGDTEMLTIDVCELDCTTFVETLYALARTTMQGRYSWRDYAQCLESVRYQGGVMGDYSTRLHYISWWIIDNHSRNNLVEVTPDLPHATSLVKTINFMSHHADSYRSLKDDSLMVAKIRSTENALRGHKMPILKKSWLNKDDVKRELRNGDFVGLVTRIEGLDISHMGTIYKDENGEIFLLDASMSAGKVTLEPQPLGRWLKDGANTLGVRVFRMMP